MAYLAMVRENQIAGCDTSADIFIVLQHAVTEDEVTAPVGGQREESVKRGGNPARRSDFRTCSKSSYI